MSLLSWRPLKKNYPFLFLEEEKKKRIITNKQLIKKKINFIEYEKSSIRKYMLTSLSSENIF